MPGCNDGDVVAQHLSMINQCIESKNLKLGKLLHSRLLKTSLSLHTLLSNRLLHMYAKCGGGAAATRAAFADIPFKNNHSWNTLLAAHCRSGDLQSARHLFDEMPHRNLVSYNTMISTLTHHGHHRQALRLFLTMRSSINSDPVAIDKFTVVGVGTACAALSDLTSLRQLHAVVIATGLGLNLIMSNVFVDAYGKCGDAIGSRLVFDRMETRDVVSWTSLLGAYARAGRMEDACWVFDRMPLRNAVSWTALISGHEQNGLEEVALELFERMVEEGVAPTAYTLVSVLSACARLGLIARGKQVHGYSVRRSGGGGVDANVFIYNALIDMYAKCGDMNSATMLFDGMSERDVVSWNSMITGFAQNGCGNKSLSLFVEMIEAGVRPTDISLLAVLSACSHTGLVSEGRNFLDLMEKDYGVRPRPEHRAAFIDALGRNCRLEEAMWFVKSLHSSSGLGSAWGALLGACQMHGNLELAKRTAEVLFELEPENSARYVTLSNIYATAGQWDEARQLRVLMKGKGMKKEPGFSWIEMKSVKHLFVAEDNSHSHTVEIYQMLNTLIDQMGVSNAICLT